MAKKKISVRNQKRKRGTSCTNTGTTSGGGGGVKSIAPSGKPSISGTDSQIEDENESQLSKIHEFSGSEIKAFRSSLLQWYDSNKRHLPWREKALVEDRNIRAYSVWVSEIMLQQTQVATVIDYYNKWMKKWPTFHDLANATLEEVNELWSGLGYYSRAKNLHLGARKVVGELGGEMPSTAPELVKQIPGVGQYTAGAIASIAFKQPTGVVDGNVIRVMTRMRTIGASTGLKTVNDLLWKLANTSVDPERPGDFNQALMELGATVCTPKQPQCSSCPVKGLCMAKTQVDEYRRTDEQTLIKPLVEPNGEMNRSSTRICDIEECALCCPSSEPWDPSGGVLNYPRKPKKKAAREERTVVLIPRCETGGTEWYYMTQRPETGLLANLWEFPSKLVNDCEEKRTLERLREELTERFAAPTVVGVRSLGEVVHIFSHIHQTYCVYEYDVRLDTKSRPEANGDGERWVTDDELQTAGVSTAMKKVFKALTEEPAKKKRKVEAKDDCKQARLDRFFSKS